MSLTSSVALTNNNPETFNMPKECERLIVNIRRLEVFPQAVTRFMCFCNCFL